MSKKCSFIPVFVVTAVLVLSSCRSYEDRVITKLNHLSERIDADGKNFDADDWEDAMEELADIHEEMTDCDFTPEQLKEVGRADGRLSAIIAKEGAKSLGREASSFLKSISSYAKGFQEGAQENVNEEDFNEVGDQIMSTLKDIEDEWKE